jgi:hypothetical protein
MDASSSRASPSVGWVFTLCRGLPRLASCRDASLCLLIFAGLHLLHMWWPSSCNGSSLPGRVSWIARRAPSWHGKTAWQLLSAHWKGMHRTRCRVRSSRGCPTRLSGWDTRFYGWLPLLLQLLPNFGGMPNPSYLIGDGPSEAGGEVGGGTSMGHIFL